MDFQHLFPQLASWVQNLVNVWPAYIIKPQFAFWEVLHILSLFLLAGATIVVGLRQIGVGLTEEKASVISKNVMPLLNIGVVGVLVTGVLIGMANAERLYNSTAFLVKMIGLLSALIFSYLVQAPVAKADGVVSPAARVWGVIAFAIWLVGLYILVTTKLINLGALHMVFAGALILFLSTSGKMRWVFGGVLALLVLAQEVATHAFVNPENLDQLDPVNKGFMWVISLWVIGFALWRIFTAKSEGDTSPMTRMIGYCAILVWVTVAAGGRWIAFA